MASLEEWHAVEPKGLAARILGVTVGFTIVCLLVVGLRVWLRLKLSTFGTEDYIMCAGVVSFHVIDSFPVAVKLTA